MCSYSSGIFPNYLVVQLQFLSLGGLFSYTGRPFTGTRPPFPQPLSSLVPCYHFSNLLRAQRSLQAGQLPILGKNSGSGCTASKIRGINSTFGCRANKIPEKNIFGWRANKNPGKTALLGANKILGKTAFLGAERTRSLGRRALLGVERTKSQEKKALWVQND